MKISISILVCSCFVDPNFAQHTMQNDSSMEIATTLSVNKKSEKQYQQAIQENPDNAIAYYNLGLFYADKNQYDYAEEQFNQAIQKDSSFSLVYTALASLFLASGQMERSVAACEKAIQMDSLSAINYLNIGKVHFQNMRFAEAERSFLSAIQVDSLNSEIYLNLGTLLMQIDRKEDAIVQFKKVLQRNPKDLGAPYSLASIYGSQNQVDDAFVFLELAIVNGIKFYDLIQMDATLTPLRERSKQWNALMKKYFPEKIKN